MEVVAWRYNMLILILSVYFITMSVVDAFVPKLYFKSSYFCKEVFVVEAFDHFKISKKQNYQSIYVVASLDSCPAFIYRVTDLSWFLVFL